ncbi:histone-lysine N-methyltransferase SETMAR [Ditylenchus destructor]|uniref:Histone-lysine N-methyltransferase SETMAR n=1 Tax=Ditylenchus destructor TaxID=166010 RepID=A0AAD4MHD7_9BILA|nr:histone-lysine N-methyltransferase SETMAR [Ditylenchus destructor]
MDPIKDQVHKDLHRLYKIGISAAEATGRITDFYAKVIVRERQVQNWFKMFKEDRKSAKRKRGSGRPVKTDRKALKNRFFRDREITTREFAAGICSQSTACRWLKKLKRKWRKQREIPHELTQEQKEKRALLRALEEKSPARYIISRQPYSCPTAWQTCAELSCVLGLGDRKRSDPIQKPILSNISIKMLGKHIAVTVKPVI